MDLSYQLSMSPSQSIDLIFKNKVRMIFSKF